MLVDVPLWQKIWNRGVDIAAAVTASTISAAIIAVIATLTWGWKRKRDLHFEEDKQRQQQRLAAEFAETERRRAVRERHDCLSQQRANLVGAMLEADPDRIKEAWTTYWDWLTSNQLNYLPGNTGIPREHRKIKTMAHMSDYSPLKKELADQMQHTELLPI